MAEEKPAHQTHEEVQKAKIEELEAIARRLQAEFENYKKYVEKERAELTLRYTATAVQKMLPMLDELEIALQNSEKASKEEFEKGMRMLHSNMAKTLKSEGLQEINALNQKFNPFMHEAIRYEESGIEEGRVSQVIKKGYMFKDRVIRHALVVVSSGKKKNEGSVKGGV